ncbi:ABC transporter substrate-binding protein [Merismopedia glauca]|uniref:ABC transporter substrate-binding protein n=1 Tax=Merismopedia glauca CCAP 1448/3 TaxID=1296344 RepID=A0A2T1CAR3_9CYAN|nr:ABC transporter substrate-binding protein [Merismopedia glauca]PSB05253.1 ABC transporter substrate-binding protein [Merismopedia glauca CCAP 1448/3]
MFGNFWRGLTRWLVLGICLMSLTGCQWLSTDTETPNVVHLTLWQGVNPPANRDILQKLVDRFNQQHPEIQVESLYVGQADQQLPKILAAVVGNAPPELLWFNSTITGQLVELDGIRPLDDWLTKSPLKEEIDPSLWEGMQYRGQTWSIPFATNNTAVFYRPSLFKAAGITELPKTWDEFREVARRLTKDTNSDGKIDQHGLVLPLGKGEFAVFLWLPFMWAGGGEIVDVKTEQPTLVNQGAIAALQFWQNLIQDGSAILSLPERGFETDGFLAGKVAMQITGPWTLAQLAATGVDFSVFPIPKGVKSATGIGGENLFLFKTNSVKEQAALKFLEYVLSEEFQTEWAMGTGYLPVNLKARNSEKYRDFTQEQPAVRVFLEQAQYGRSRPLFPGYSRLSDRLGRAIESVLLNRNSPQQALQTAQQRLDLIFK